MRDGRSAEARRQKAQEALRRRFLAHIVGAPTAEQEALADRAVHLPPIVAGLRHDAKQRGLSREEHVTLRIAQDRLDEAVRRLGIVHRTRRASAAMGRQEQRQGAD